MEMRTGRGTPSGCLHPSFSRSPSCRTGRGSTDAAAVFAGSAVHSPTRACWSKRSDLRPLREKRDFLGSQSASHTDSTTPTTDQSHNPSWQLYVITRRFSQYNDLWRRAKFICRFWFSFKLLMVTKCVCALDYKSKHGSN